MGRLRFFSLGPPGMNPAVSAFRLDFSPLRGLCFFCRPLRLKILLPWLPTLAWESAGCDRLTAMPAPCET